MRHINEDFILADGQFVKHYLDMYGKGPMFSHQYVRPEDNNPKRENFEICIEVNHTGKFWGKYGAMRMPITNEEQYLKFKSFAL